MTDDVEREIEQRVAAATRLLTLNQAHEALGKVRNDLKHVRLTVENWPAYTDAIDRIINNELEGLMWRIEQTVIAEGKKA